MPYFSGVNKEKSQMKWNIQPFTDLSELNIVKRREFTDFIFKSLGSRLIHEIATEFKDKFINLICTVIHLYLKTTVLILSFKLYTKGNACQMSYFVEL